MARRIEEAWIDRIIGRRQDEAAALRIRLQEMRREPFYEVRDLLDRLLVDHFFACWLRVQCLELESLHSVGKGPEDELKRTRLYGLAQDLLMNAMQAIRMRQPAPKRAGRTSSAPKTPGGAPAAPVTTIPAASQPANGGTTPAPGTVAGAVHGKRFPGEQHSDNSFGRRPPLAAATPCVGRGPAA